MDLMAKEEHALAQNKRETHEQICRKVDAGLRAETAKHCDLQSTANKKL